MKKQITLWLIAMLAGTLMASGQVIISQIYEGASYNKYLEITNLGTTPVDMTNPQLTIKLFSNKTEIGSNTPNKTSDLSGTLLAGESMVLRHPQAAAPAYALSYTPGDTSLSVNFNGTGTSGDPLASTDIVALYNGTTLVDVFGWGTFQYKDSSCYRKLSVVAPNPVWTVTEWTKVATGDVDNALAGTIERLGYHGAVSTTPAITISSPGQGSTIYSPDVNIMFTVYNFSIPDSGYIRWALDWGPYYYHNSTSPISVTGLTDGPHTVELMLVDTDSIPLTPPVSVSVSFTVNLAGPNITSVYEIQYTTLPSGDSPWNDSIVTTTGIVTAAYSGGYFIQDGIDPWNGLYVFDNSHSPSRGDSILITGTIYEYYNYTEIKTITDFNIITTGNALPAPAAVTTASVKQEQWEGMLVHLENAACIYVHPTGWWEVLQGGDTCEIGKLMFPYSAAVTGTNYNVTGCVNYSYDEFKIEPRDINDIQVYIGIHENAAGNFALYPNPATDKLHIELAIRADRLRIINTAGQMVKEIPLDGKPVSIDISELPAGTYSASIFENGKVAGTRIFVKQ